MPRPDEQAAPQAAPQAGRHAPLNLMAPADSTNTAVLHAIQALNAKLDQVLSIIAPRKSALTLDPDEIARTMAQLRSARPISKETPP